MVLHCSMGLCKSFRPCSHFQMFTCSKYQATNNSNFHLRAALNTPATKSPGTPGMPLSVSITNNGRSWSFAAASCRCTPQDQNVSTSKYIKFHWLTVWNKKGTILCIWKVYNQCHNSGCYHFFHTTCSVFLYKGLIVATGF